MKTVVLDTNVIVSALWSKSDNAAEIYQMFLQGSLRLCHDPRILAEYKGVLNRPEFAFVQKAVSTFLSRIRREGIPIIPIPCLIDFTDEDGKKFYEVAKVCNAILITGNLRHYPDEPWIMAPAQFLAESRTKR
jgi:putative PIN family toxin of toxin-antitoxin system